MRRFVETRPLRLYHRLFNLLLLSPLAEARRKEDDDGGRAIIRLECRFFAARGVERDAPAGRFRAESSGERKREFNELEHNPYVPWRGSFFFRGKSDGGLF